MITPSSAQRDFIKTIKQKFDNEQKRGAEVFCRQVIFEPDSSYINGAVPNALTFCLKTVILCAPHLLTGSPVMAVPT